MAMSDMQNKFRRYGKGTLMIFADDEVMIAKSCLGIKIKC
jgi:hypothetical protein